MLLTHQSDVWVYMFWGKKGVEEKDKEGKKEEQAWEKSRWVKSLDCLQMAVRIGRGPPVRAQAVFQAMCLGVHFYMQAFLC